MASNFIGLDDAAEKLGVDKDRLNQLREAGQLRAYRDGASWKFRAEEIEKLETEGIPSPAGDSELGVASLSDLTLDLGDSGKLEDSEKLGELELADESASASAEPSGVSDVDLGSLEDPTVPADELALAEAPGDVPKIDPDDSDLVLDTEASGDDAESILLSDAELGDAPLPSPSTIIGRSELELESDDDLELAPAGSGAAEVSDVRLADSGAVLSDDDDGSAVVSGASKQDEASKFEDLEELEIDLEAESSRILDAEDTAKAKAAIEAAKAESGESDLSLAPTDSEVGLAGLSSADEDNDKQPSEAGLTGISSIGEGSGAAGDSLTGLSSVELADDAEDDFVLGDSGSDITLASDSGINLSPSDSGLALDEPMSGLGGSQLMGSGIDLGSISSASGVASESATAGVSDLASDEDFLLTPLGEDDEADDEESSQIIAIESVGEDAAADASLLGDAGAVDLGSPDVDAVGVPAGGVAMVEDTQFSTGVIIGLSSCLALMVMCGIMALDLLRTIWSWNERYEIKSGLIEGLLGIFG